MPQLGFVSEEIAEHMSSNPWLEGAPILGEGIFTPNRCTSTHAKPVCNVCRSRDCVFCCSTLRINQYMSMNISIHQPIYVYVSTNICLCINEYISIYQRMFVYVSTNIYISTNIHLYFNEYISIYQRIYLFVPTNMYQQKSLEALFNSLVCIDQFIRKNSIKYEQLFTIG